MTAPVTVAGEVRRIRGRKTQAEFAEELDVTPRTIIRWERAQEEPGRGNRQKLIERGADPQVFRDLELVEEIRAKQQELSRGLAEIDKLLEGL